MSFFLSFSFFFFFFNDTATTEIYTLSLHDALPISPANYRDRTLAPPGSWPAGAVRILNRDRPHIPGRHGFRRDDTSGRRPRVGRQRARRAPGRARGRRELEPHAPVGDRLRHRGASHRGAGAPSPRGRGSVLAQRRRLCVLATLGRVVATGALDARAGGCARLFSRPGRPTPASRVAASLARAVSRGRR